MAKLVQPYQIAIPKKLVKKIGFKSENKNDKADILSIKVEPTVFPNIYFETVMQEKRENAGVQFRRNRINLFE